MTLHGTELPVKTDIPRPLDDRHREELQASGLSDETIAAAGLYSAGSAEVRHILGWQVKDRDWDRALVFPFRKPDGTDAGYSRVKPDYPRDGQNGKAVKYESPLKTPNRCYFPPNWSEVSQRGTLCLTEGEKKCLAVSQCGIACIGLTGVWSWQRRRQKSDTGRAFGRREPIDDLQRIVWKNREVVIVFDSDAASNGSVKMSESKLAEVLEKLGAVVRIARIPSNGDAKVGADDFIVANGPDAFRSLLSQAEPAETPPPPSVRDNADMFVAEFFTGENGVELAWHRGVFYRWVGTHWVEVPEGDLFGIVFEWLDELSAKVRPCHAADVVKALTAVCRVPHDIEPPTFLDDRRRTIAATNIIPVRNGLLDLSDIGGPLALHEHTPQWFCFHSRPFPFDPDARCPLWEAFLWQVLEDSDRIRLLQQWFGLLLTSDTSWQKMLLMPGPKRAGKGTVVRVLQHVVGPDACVSPSLSSLGDRFGLWQLLGKTVATFPDAHIGFRADGMRILEVVKSIVGEDTVSIDRKNLPFLPNVKLGVRFVVTVNELPHFSDASDALGARLCVLPFEKTFVGSEDTELTDRLKTEASGILNWALRGLHDLRTTGRFVVPAKAQVVAENFRRLSSPVLGFVDDECRLDRTAWVPIAVLYAAWVEYCKTTGHTPGAVEEFGEQLKAACACVTRKQHRDGGKRKWCYDGIRLRKSTDDPSLPTDDGAAVTGVTGCH